jgi:hypothetical protein
MATTSETTKDSSNRLNRCVTGIASLCDDLNRDDSELRSHLLDAALAGLRLTRHPQSQEFRRDASKAWNVIEPVLAHHLAAEDPVMMEWLERYARLSPEVLFRVRECHYKLKQLAGAIEQSRFESPQAQVAVQAGRVLSGLAVCLDDMIDDEEHKIFPAIHRALFEMDRGV